MSDQDDSATPQEVGNSIFPYPGGKSYLGNWIVEHLPDHDCYVEVFGGSAAVLLSKEESAVEVYNDQDGDLVHFFETFRDQTDELVDYLRITPYSKDVHEKWGRQFYAGYRPDDDIERAARFFYLRFSQFAGKYNGHSGFRTARQRSVASQLSNACEKLHAFADRFDSVMIENRDYSDIFERFDGPRTVFYCDPPYVEEGDALYTHGQFDHHRFTSELTDLEGDWLVSYTDVPAPLRDYQTVEREIQYSSQDGSDGSHKQATERIVLSFNPSQKPAFSQPTQATLGDLRVADGGEPSDD